MRTYIQEMHAASPHFTRRDTQLMLSFFQKSPEKYYISPSGVKYYQPDDSRLFDMASQIFSLKYYSSLGMNKHLILPHPDTKEDCPCSMLWLKKRPDHIAFERENRGVTSPKSWWNPFASYDRQKILQIIHEQQKILINMDKKLYYLTPKWNYDCYKFCCNSKFLNFGMSLQDADELHAFLLFYKKCDVDPTQESGTDPKPPLNNFVHQIDLAEPEELEQADNKTILRSLIKRVIAAITWIFSFISCAIRNCASKLRFYPIYSTSQGVS
jgi:hypothetical protein